MAKRSFNKYLVKNLDRVEKRIRFVLSAIVMSTLMILSTFFYFDKAWIFISLFIIVCYVCTFFSVLEGIERVEWITLFLMPILLSISFYLFYFLFPIRWITRLPFIVLYGFSIYAILLSSNIFNVGVEKSLQLYRAAFSVNYFYHTFIIFLMLSVILSFKLNFILNSLAIFILAFLMSMQLLWTVKPKIFIEKHIYQYAFMISFFITEVAIILSFIPLKPAIFALFLSTCYYSLNGLVYHYLDQKLFKQTVREYLFVLGFVFVITVLSIQW